MKLKDLQFGDRLTLRNGERYIYADGYMCGEDTNFYCDADCMEDNYNENLIREYNFGCLENSKDYDVVKVERPVGHYITFERKIEQEPVEMTIKEISEKLGYEVKVVKEK